jgi:hypothetical protein
VHEVDDCYAIVIRQEPDRKRLFGEVSERDREGTIDSKRRHLSGAKAVGQRNVHQRLDNGGALAAQARPKKPERDASTVDFSASLVLSG